MLDLDKPLLGIAWHHGAIAEVDQSNNGTYAIRLEGDETWFFAGKGEKLAPKVGMRCSTLTRTKPSWGSIIYGLIIGEVEIW